MITNNIFVQLSVIIGALAVATTTVINAIISYQNGQTAAAVATIVPSVAKFPLLPVSVK